MKIIGILGGIASGKSFVAACLRQYGAALLDGDAAGHEVLREPEVERAVRGRWGGAVLGPDGRVDRRALGRIVFGPQPAAAAELQFLEQLTHPRIGERLREQSTRFAADKYPAAVLDAPVLLKAGWDAFCDELLFVDAPSEQRLARAVARGWTAEEFARREAAQEPLPEKRARCDEIIDNSGTPDQTRHQLGKFWHSLFSH